MAAQELGVPIGNLRLIAAHPWDVVGALQAGCKAAFVARKNQICYSLTQKPDIIGDDLTSVTDQILKLQS